MQSVIIATRMVGTTKIWCMHHLSRRVAISIWPRVGTVRSVDVKLTRNRATSPYSRTRTLIRIVIQSPIKYYTLSKMRIADTLRHKRRVKSSRRWPCLSFFSAQAGLQTVPSIVRRITERKWCWNWRCNQLVRQTQVRYKSLRLWRGPQLWQDFQPCTKMKCRTNCASPKYPNPYSWWNHRPLINPTSRRPQSRHLLAKPCPRLLIFSKSSNSGSSQT